MISVLVCDDSMVARKQVAKCLPPDWEVAIHFAKHGKEAVELLRQGKGQLLLLDLNMPVMDGYETLQAIRDENLQTKVVVISGDVQPEAHERVTKLGAVEFIRKPVDPTTLEQVLIKHQLMEAKLPLKRRLN